MDTTTYFTHCICNVAPIVASDALPSPSLLDCVKLVKELTQYVPMDHYWIIFVAVVMWLWKKICQWQARNTQSTQSDHRAMDLAEKMVDGTLKQNQHLTQMLENGVGHNQQVIECLMKNNADQGKEIAALRRELEEKKRANEESGKVIAERDKLLAEKDQRIREVEKLAQARGQTIMIREQAISEQNKEMAKLGKQLEEKDVENMRLKRQLRKHEINNATATNRQNVGSLSDAYKRNVTISPRIVRDTCYANAVSVFMGRRSGHETFSGSAAERIRRENLIREINNLHYTFRLRKGIA